MLNPKIIAFFVAFFPQFLVPEAPALEQLGVLGGTFLVLVFVIFAAYAFLAGGAQRLIGRASIARACGRAAGLTLIGAGVFTATLRRG
jgi:threonine/homoserine/homoserine lactone efflux protein